MTLEEIIISTYCMVDEKIKTFLNGKKLRRGGFEPKLTDAEVLTMEIVGEFLSIHCDKHIWSFFKTHYCAWFPDLGSRTNFVERCANLNHLKNNILSFFFKENQCDILHMADGVPIPIIRLARAKRDRCFQGHAEFGYCASKDEHYYGFLGHIVINSAGQISGFQLTPANGSERNALKTILEDNQKIQGIMLGDKGYIGENFKQELAQSGIDLQTPLRKNMPDKRNPKWISWIISKRRLVETVIGQLTERFAINAIRVKDFWHLQCRVTRKLLAHCVISSIALTLGLPPTSMARIYTP